MKRWVVVRLVIGGQWSVIHCRGEACLARHRGPCLKHTGAGYGVSRDPEGFVFKVVIAAPA